MSDARNLAKSRAEAEANQKKNTQYSQLAAQAEENLQEE